MDESDNNIILYITNIYENLTTFVKAVLSDRFPSCLLMKGIGAEICHRQVEFTELSTFLLLHKRDLSPVHSQSHVFIALSFYKLGSN